MINANVPLLTVLLSYQWFTKYQFRDSGSVESSRLMIVNNVRACLVKLYTYAVQAVHAPHSALPYCWFCQDFLHLCDRSTHIKFQETGAPVSIPSVDCIVVSQNE